MDDAVRLGVDVGGTFTDVVLIADGEVTTAKVPTTDDQSEGVLRGIEQACDQAGIDPETVTEFRHAMTVGTNAMLEQSGATTALVTTEGFGDVLEIGRQERPDLYDLSARKTPPLVPAQRRYELTERATTEGVESAPDPDAIDDIADQLDDDVESVAVSLLHAYAHPANEQVVADQLATASDQHVVASHETLPEFREYERTATTVVDAYVTPVIEAYLDRLRRQAVERNLPAPRVMQSNGGIADVDAVRAHGVRTVLSGPAAGVVGASLFERDASGLISVDMGGTSTDVGLVTDGEIARTSDARVGGHPVHVPMVDVETVGAGGGSIAWVDSGGALRVGPDSAGADPGPACYGRGGDDPTVTDAALQLGYLGPDTELGGAVQLDERAAASALADLAATANLDGPTAAARGVHRVANAAMTRAIRSVTVERGHDPREFALVAFGGAGPMHAGALAAGLGIERVRVPRANGVLSALGLLAADERHDASQTHRVRLDAADPESIDAIYENLVERAREAATEPAQAHLQYRADLRYVGQSHELTVDLPRPFDADAAESRFHAAHERTRGYRLPDEDVELVTLRVTATATSDQPELTHRGASATERTRRPAQFGDEVRETPVYRREQVPSGTTLAGPAIFEGGESTVVVPPDWEATVDDRGTIELAQSGAESGSQGETA
jgi:N-methylhydantoinase A